MRKEKLKTECPEPVRGRDYNRNDLFKDVEYEPRINNIERINNKIKKILESTQEEREKGPSTIELKPTPTPQQARKKAEEERKI